MRRVFFRLSSAGAVNLTAAAMLIGFAVHAYGTAPPSEPGCSGISAKDCLELALTAMGGRERLESLKSVRLEVAGHTALMEQSYRQQPFISSYVRDRMTLDLTGHRLMSQRHGVWPEADPGQAESDRTVIAGMDGCIYKADKQDAPCSGGDFEDARAKLALGPERLLLLASAAPDLHFEAAEMLRSTPHATVAFAWNGLPVRILLNQWNHLPDAVETKQQFKDFWYFWGDVRQVTYWDGWNFVHGVKYPTSQVIERNGAVWSSSQVIDIEFNGPLSEPDFAWDPKTAQASAKGKGWAREFRDDHHVQLAEGVDLFQGSWNATVVRQDDGVVILETPISGSFTKGLFTEAQKLYPGVPIKAALSTSDSWPHVGGVRFDVSQGVPVHILDLNQPLLERMLAAPHAIDPDELEKGKKAPNWRIVSGRTEVGSGRNRMVLYPLRGASTERQYMVYFPEHRLLYASDTLVVNPDNTLYDPELVREVQQAVEREGLDVDTVFAMHEGPKKWSDVVKLIEKAAD